MAWMFDATADAYNPRSSARKKETFSVPVIVALWALAGLTATLIVMQAIGLDPSTVSEFAI